MAATGVCIDSYFRLVAAVPISADVGGILSQRLMGHRCHTDGT